MKTSITGLLILTFSAVMISCGDDGGSDKGPCDQFNWRDATTDQIVCPYTENCVCPSTDVCCVIVEQDKFSSASCSQLASCSGLAFGCDGPEDCQTGESCCAVLTTGGGSSCGDPMDCIGLDEVILCRQDEHCGLGSNCLPAEPDSYFEGVAGYCD
jgi:hypothetical protein